MSLIEKVKADQLAARKAKDSLATALLTTLLGEVGTAAKNAGHELATDDEVIATVKKFIKNNESIPEAVRHVTHDAELCILESYLPKQLSADEIELIFLEHAPTNKGEAMKLLKERYAGLYDGKLAAQIFDKR